MSKVPGEGDVLAPKQRAIDILLGSLGFAEEAELVSIERSTSGYSGTLRFADGEIVPFCSEDNLSELEEWALRVLIDQRT